MKKRNPQKPDEPQKWYAAPMSEAALSVKAMTRAATENTTTAPIEMESAFELFMRYAVQQLQQLISVQAYIGLLGFQIKGTHNGAISPCVLGIEVTGFRNFPQGAILKVHGVFPPVLVKLTFIKDWG